MITALQPSGGNPICGRREPLLMRIDKCQSCSSQSRNDGWMRIDRLSSAASADEESKKSNMDLSWRKTVAQKPVANGLPSSGHTDSKTSIVRRNSSLSSDALGGRRCAEKSLQSECLNNGTKEVNGFGETTVCLSSNIPTLSGKLKSHNSEEMTNGTPVRRVGSLTSSPKWSRIKRTFERQNSDGSENKSDTISKTLSRSSNTLAIPRYLADKDLGSENGPLMKSKSLPSCGVLQLHYAQNTCFTQETVGLFKPSTTSDHKGAESPSVSLVKPSSLIARSQSFKQNRCVDLENNVNKNESDNRTIVSAKREASALYKNKSGYSLEQLHNCSFKNKIAIDAATGIGSSTSGVEKTRRLYLQSECATVLKTASSTLLKSNVSVGLKESRNATINTSIPVGRLFSSSREIKSSLQKCANGNGISQVRVDECLGLNGSKNAWKQTPSGAWVKAKDVPEVHVNGIEPPRLKTNSKVALLAQKFDHLSNSVDEQLQESSSETESTSKINFRKPKPKPPALKNGELPIVNSKPATQIGKVKACQNGSDQDNRCNNKRVDESEEDIFADAVQNSKNRKYSLVQQVVQNFEEHCQLNITDNELVFQYQKESRSSQESWCTKIPHESAKKGHYSVNNFRQTTESVQKVLNKSVIGTQRSGLLGQQKRPTPSGRKPPPPLPASARSKQRQGILSDGGEEPANNVVGDDLLSSMEDWLEQKCLRANDGSPSVKPNPSFLWHQLGPRLTSESAENEPGGYYSVPFQHLQKFQQEEHIYMDATLLRKSPASQRKSSSNSSSIHLNDAQGSSCSSDEGWVDMSDAEADQNDSNRTSRVVGVQLRPRSRSSKSDSYRRSWSQSLRDLSNAVDTDTEEWEANEYQDISVWESGDTGTSSSSTNSDHIYETLYDVIVEDREQDLEDNETYEIVEHGDHPSSKMQSSISVDTGIDSVPARTSSANSADDGSEDKAENEKGEGLKRNWSLTKSDIRLELSSKLNKIKTRKNFSSTTDIGDQVHQPTSPVPESKKKTLIKFILRQKSNPAPIVQKKRAGNHKKGATFYVRWSVVDKNTRGRSQSESALVEATKVDSPVMRRQTSERVQSVRSKEDAVKPCVTVKRRPSGAGAIKRPTSPPPLPPVPAANTTRTRTGTKSLELLPSKSVVSRTDSNKSRSLDVDRAVTFDFGDGKHELRKGDSLGVSNFPNQGSESHINLITPQSRISIASKSSFAGSYIQEDEVASIPKPTSLLLSAEQDDGNENSYLQLHLPALPQETLKSPFEEEPLYQFYQRHVSRRATMWYTINDTDAESDISETASSQDNDEEYCVPEKLHPTAMDLLHHSRSGLRTLWCEVPEVIKSGIPDKITPQERKLQEAMFEVITSEASYLKSLNILVEHFMKRPEFSDDFSCNCVLERRERHVLFSDVLPVRDVSMRVLADLEKRWQENFLISNICDILHEHASKFFSVYVRYCSNQVYQERKLKELKSNRPDFVEVLQRVEGNPICQGLDMHSFLMLPMQRITRMPLLVDAIFHRLPLDSPYYEICKLTLAQLNKVVWECNEGARKMERMEEMLVISRQLDFKDAKSIALISASRWLVKRGELTRIAFDVFAKRTFGRSARCSKTSMYLFLFTDLLLIAKKKSDDSYTVLDYCPRNMVQVFTIENSGLPLPMKLPENYKNLFQLTMLQNHEGKTVEMMLSCPLESDRTRWMEAVTPPKSENPEEKIYEQWDCPQVQCIYSYAAQQPDELSLDESDVVNVFRKMSDGWYEGERLRDGVRGWFPASFTVEIISSHIRARNLRQRYRLLVLSHAYLEEQRKACQSQCAKSK